MRTGSATARTTGRRTWLFCAAWLSIWPRSSPPKRRSRVSSSAPDGITPTWSPSAPKPQKGKCDSPECLDLIGLEHADAVLPSVVGQMAAARGAEEMTAWRHPVDLVALCDEAAAEFPELFRTARRCDGWSDHAELSAAILGDDANTILAALKAAVQV